MEKKWEIIWCGKCHTMPYGGSALESKSLIIKLKSDLITLHLLLQVIRL